MNPIEPDGAHVGYCREAARSVVRRHHLTGPPVDVQAIAAAEGYLVRYALLGEVEGRMRQLGGQWLIELNQDRHVNSQRFTIAHEVGHLVMGHQGCGSSAVEERQANVFAAELLIPLSMLRIALKKTRRLSELAALFRVSKEAMQYKLNEHGLLLRLTSFD
jgi:hypothetical protein